MTIPPGTRGSERRCRLRGKGFGRLARRGRGDLIVRTAVVVPSSPSEREKELLREYAELVGAPVAGVGVLKKAKKIFS